MFLSNFISVSGKLGAPVNWSVYLPRELRRKWGQRVGCVDGSGRRVWGGVFSIDSLDRYYMFTHLLFLRKYSNKHVNNLSSLTSIGYWVITQRCWNKKKFRQLKNMRNRLMWNIFHFSIKMLPWTKFLPHCFSMGDICYFFFKYYLKKNFYFVLFHFLLSMQVIYNQSILSPFNLIKEKSTLNIFSFSSNLFRKFYFIVAQISFIFASWSNTFSPVFSPMSHVCLSCNCIFFFSPPHYCLCHLLNFSIVLYK